MCGIAGLLRLDDGPAPSRELAADMALALRHRGPDGQGLHAEGPVALAHARLAIVDRAGGAQPMVEPTSGACLTYNGELFNHVELRAELEARGRRFHTRSDTEVVLHAFLEWGDDAPARFDGQWALALWQPGERRLRLARDPAGILPLFWTEQAGLLRFASEVKALFVDPRVPRGFSPEGLDEALTFWAAVAPRTPFAGVSQLEPGVLASLEVGRDREPRPRRRLWPPFLPGTDTPRHDPDEDARLTAEVRDRLTRAAGLRLRADVPVGSYLSGGLDSTILAGLVAGHAEVPLRTFSLTFTDPAYDEADHQAEAVAALGTEHTSVRVSDADIAAVFPAVVRHAEAPLLRSAPAPLFLLARLVRESGHRVVLTGEGADEAFAGYDLFREDRVRRFWARQPESRSRPRLLSRLYPYLARSPVAHQAMAQAFFVRNLTEDLLELFGELLVAQSRVICMHIPEKRIRGN